MYKKGKVAFGAPGMSARWTSSAKSGVGTALNPSSKVWYSIGHGILNEIYYPQVDQACTRDLGFIVTDGKNFFSEEKKDTSHHIRPIAKGIPGYHITNCCNRHQYRIEKEIISDPVRDTILQRIHFIPSKLRKNDFKLYVLLAPQLQNFGTGNTAMVGDYKGVPMLFAKREGVSLAMACSVPWKKMSVGYVGNSDGWQDLMRHKQMYWEFNEAENGNIALTAEIDLSEINGSEFTIALGFGSNPEEAGQRARASLCEGYESARVQFIHEWEVWQKALYNIKETKRFDPPKYFHFSASMLKVHESKRHPGGLIASLSIPWGFSRGDDNLGGYHLVWPRDMVQIAGGLLAANALEDARRVLNYLMVTQEADGHWPQNMWLDGTPYWKGIQMDQTALPVLLVELINKEAPLTEKDIALFWPMMRRAAEYLVTNGPTTEQDRWEENGGYSTYTLAVEIAALLITADYAELNDEPELAVFLKETADFWNSCIEKWTYVSGSELAEKVGVEGYYVRINPSHPTDDPFIGSEPLLISNRGAGENICTSNEMVSPDALALVRFGLRAPDDPRILNTIKVIDTLLKRESNEGPLWYRYNRDGYGETHEGQPFNGVGVGRPWPLLTGERAHYEIAAGNFIYVSELLKTIENHANEIGLFPEQIWDAEDLPEYQLYNGKPTGSAMPLVWAHAEYIKLCRSLDTGKVYDMPSQTANRYLIKKITSKLFIWNFTTRNKYMAKGKTLRIQCLTSAIVRWSVDNWQTYTETPTLDSGIGIHYTDISTDKMNVGGKIDYTFYWLEAECWENTDFSMIIREADNENNSAALSPSVLAL